MRALLSFLIMVSSTALAQENFQAEATEQTLTSTNALQVPSPAAKRPEQLVRPDGFLVELSRTNRPLRMLSLRQRADPKRDMRNLVHDPATGRIVGFRLLSFEF
jgi:hypothetical protein